MDGKMGLGGLTTYHHGFVGNGMGTYVCERPYHGSRLAAYGLHTIHTW